MSGLPLCESRTLRWVRLSAMSENEIHDVEDQMVPEEPAPAFEREPIPWGAILLLLWAVLIIIFAVQNAHTATVEFLAWDWEMPVALLIMITALVTVVVTGVGFAFYRRRRRKNRASRESGQSES